MEWLEEGAVKACARPLPNLEVKAIWPAGVLSPS